MEETGDLRINRTAPAPEEVVGARLRLELLRELPERQERLIWLQGLGFSYPEMATETDMTVRTVERQLMKARRKPAVARPGRRRLTGPRRRQRLSGPCRACAACVRPR